MLTDKEIAYFDRISVDMDDSTASLALHRLSDFLCHYYGKKVIILLDEYDTPMLEAYVRGYWEELGHIHFRKIWGIFWIFRNRGL